MSWGGVLSDRILMMGEAENPFCVSCALGSQHHKGYFQALLIISFYTLKEKLKRWWQMASFITFNWLTALLSLWSTHFGPKHCKKNMPFTLVCCQVTLKKVQEVFARAGESGCTLTPAPFPPGFYQAWQYRPFHEHRAEMVLEWNCYEKGEATTKLYVSMFNRECLEWDSGGFPSSQN